MHRCLQLARLGLDSVSPNPMVGSVIVFKNRVIGEGYHEKYGQAHAEVNAINSVKNQELLKDSTLYVNLEPCSHYGKTPPCADLIIEKKIPRVVIACKDSCSLVCGAGIEKLEKAKCEVLVGILEPKARELNKRFFTFHEKKRPYIILKWAQTADGFIDKIRRKKGINASWITNDICKKLVHKWRSEEDAFMVGTNTAVLDNPQLTTRNWTGKNPLRIVIDRTLKIPVTHYLRNDKAKTFFFTEKTHKNTINTEFIQIDFSQNILPQIIKELFNRSVQSLVVEGGTQLLQSFIDADLWDETRIFTNTELFFQKGVAAPKIGGTVTGKEMYSETCLVMMENKM
ncbi:MAG TPA: bifunctional diaminohydroxyphosphoribosylaminopyrimidine deaminase/5-amino-6-(5-phosphoribosylamino)uracil reductase RibD [Bacteroidales bacterium]|nr:bifunctional diaminohydroxyphosphoribosylaminopyrimidine deaminase/5-amino-6-(5-phosphoribosylamino)uracil reductase RibD [Bacteroidales bacterium]